MASDEEELPKTIGGPGAVPGSLHREMPDEMSENGDQSQSPAGLEKAPSEADTAEPSEPSPPQTQSLHHEMPENGGQSQSPAGLERAPSESDTAEPSEPPPPQTQSPADPRFSMEPHAPEGPAPAGPGAVDSVPPPPGLADGQTKPRSLFPALAATAVAGAILGFGGTLGLRYFGGSQINGLASGERIAALTARIDAIERKGDSASAGARTALAAIETRVAAAEGAAGKAAELANSAQADAQKAFASRPAAQEPAPGSAPAEVPDLGPLEARIGSLEQKLVPLESALAAPKGDLRAKPDRENAGQGSRAQAIAIVAQSLLRKLDRGRQFPGELAALENLGAAPATLAPLRAVSESTVSSERQLTARFAALVPGIIASESAKQASADESFLDRLTRNAKGLLRVRRVGDAEAASVQGFVARIENALADHDLETAYETWKKLPGAATTQSESWGEAAKARLDALNAARSIEADAVAVLGKPKP